MSNFQNISTAIQNVLAGVTELQAIADYETTKFDGFPAATSVPSETRADVFDTNSDQVQYVFRVRVVNPHKDDPESSESTMREAVDAVMEAFIVSNDLNNIVDFLEPIPSAWGYVEADQSVLRTADIELVCRVLKDL